MLLKFKPISEKINLLNLYQTSPNEENRDESRTKYLRKQHKLSRLKGRCVLENTRK